VLSFGDIRARIAATDEIREGEGGCLFDEIQNLVEPTERLHTDVQAGPQRGRTPERRGQSHAFDSAMPGEGTMPERLGQTENTRPDGELWSKRFTNVEVGGYEEWKGLSDHRPLLVDVEVEGN
jgi:hypothetical protein